MTLTQAVVDNDPNTLGELLGQGADVTERDPLGLTALQLARFLGRQECGQILGDASAHRIQVVDAQSRRVVALTPEQFRTHFGVAYLPHMRATYAQLQHLYRLCLTDRKARFFDGRRHWLGALHSPDILQGGIADVVIQHAGRKLGYGLFAGRDYRSGEYLGLYTGNLVQRHLFRLNVNDYCFRMPSGRWQLRPFMIDAKRAGNELRFVNHSNEPNVETIGVPFGGIVQILYRTTAALKRGQQFFCDYGQHAWLRRGLTPVP